ncbi:MAG: sugar ABC transporter permease [Clostridiales bacterium]|nr:sugar ABC transporter permease [Clostridiales bacterium]
MKRFKLKHRDAVSAYVMLIPFMVFFLLFVIYPMIKSVLDSFTNYNLYQRDFIGFRNYVRLAQDKIFLRSILNTLVFAVFSIVPLMVLGLTAAILVNRQSKVMYACRAALIYPYVTSMVAVSMVWLYMFDPTNGMLNKILGLFGAPRQWFLHDETQALWCLIVVNIWKNIGYVMMIYLAALQSVPTSLYEAATMDGAGGFRMTFSITLPTIKPITFFLLTTLSVECFKTFEQVRIMTNGGPVSSTTTITHQIYMAAFSEFKMGYASAMSVVLLAIVFVMTVINLKLGRQLEDL